MLALSLLATATLIQAPPAAAPPPKGLTVPGVESTTFRSKTNLNPATSEASEGAPVGGEWW